MTRLLGLVLAITSLSLLISCAKVGKLERNIVQKIERCSRLEECVINLSELVKFKWDKMFVFDYTISLEKIHLIMGVKPSKFHEFTRRIIFLNEGEIVRTEETFLDIFDGPRHKEIVFPFTGKLNYLSYTPETAFFRVKKENLMAGNYYYLLSETVIK